MLAVPEHRPKIKPNKTALDSWPSLDANIKKQKRSKRSKQSKGQVWIIAPPKVIQACIFCIFVGTESYTK
jgi:hypothetical protein